MGDLQTKDWGWAEKAILQWEGQHNCLKSSKQGRLGPPKAENELGHDIPIPVLKLPRWNGTVVRCHIFLYPGCLLSRPLEKYLPPMLPQPGENQNPWRWCLWISSGFLSAPRLGFLGPVPPSVWIWNSDASPLSITTKQNKALCYSRWRSFRTKDHERGCTELFTANNFKIHIWHSWLIRSFSPPCARQLFFLAQSHHPPCSSPLSQLPPFQVRQIPLPVLAELFHLLPRSHGTKRCLGSWEHDPRCLSSYDSQQNFLPKGIWVPAIKVLTFPQFLTPLLSYHYFYSF